MVPQVKSTDGQKHNDQKIKIICRKNAQGPAEKKIRSNIYFALSLLHTHILGDNQYFGDQVTAEHEKKYNKSSDIKKFMNTLQIAEMMVDHDNKNCTKPCTIQLWFVFKEGRSFFRGNCNQSYIG